jgi:hypothetical protein
MKASEVGMAGDGEARTTTYKVGVVWARNGYDGEVGELWGQCVVTLHLGRTTTVT